MSWVKLDDQFPDHPKVVAAGGDAAWLYVAGLCYCQAKLTDGRIPVAVVPRLTDRKAPMKLADRLVDVRLWERDGDDYRVHDYHAMNESGERVKAKREANRNRLAAWREKRNCNNVTDSVSDADGNVVTNTSETQNVRSPANRLPLTASANHLENSNPPVRDPGAPWDANEVRAQWTAFFGIAPDAGDWSELSATAVKLNGTATARGIAVGEFAAAAFGAFRSMLDEWLKKGIEGGADPATFNKHFAKVCGRIDGKKPAPPGATNGSGRSPSPPSTTAVRGAAETDADPELKARYQQLVAATATKKGRA